MRVLCPTLTILACGVLSACGGDSAGTSEGPVTTPSTEPSTASPALPADPSMSTPSPSEPASVPPASPGSAPATNAPAEPSATGSTPSQAPTPETTAPGASGPLSPDPVAVTPAPNGGTPPLVVETAGQGTGGTPAPAGSGGAAGGDEPVAGAGGMPTTPPGNGSLSVDPENVLWTAVRYYTGSTPSSRTSGPAMGPTEELTVRNDGAAATEVSVSLVGADADLFEILEPNGPTMVGAGQSLTVSVRIITADSALGPAPAQDDGATVLHGDLEATAGDVTVSSTFYALVLTYVELEPTFGQILDAFPYDSDIGTALRTDANPNPSTLPGVEAGTDEVAAPSFTRAVASDPVTFTPIARFSPSGEVPFGYYTPGNPNASTEVGAMAMQSDPNTNDKSRMLEPPLARGGTEFEPSTEPFGIFMKPEGVSPIYSEDDKNSDGQHRIKVFQLRELDGTPIANTYLVGGEEASNGDYQDYVFVLGNVQPE